MKRSMILSGLGMFLILAVTALGLVPSGALGAVPKLINFQGVLKDSAGNTPAVDMLSVTFTIYDAPLGGATFWTETHSITISDGGRFNVLLGSFNPIPDSVFADTVRWLGIKVETDPEMLPRQQMASVGYAYRVNSVDGASGGTIFGNTSIQSDLTVSGNVGIGTASPGSRLDVAGGNVNLENSAATTGNILKGGQRFIHNFGTNNTFIGLNAGNLTMSGVDNTASGAYALWSNTEGVANTASGVGALGSNTTGFANTASGVGALGSNTTGESNTACGNEALFSNTIGLENTASGAFALQNNTTGNSNTANGVTALSFNTTGEANTASGVTALSFNTTGIGNTASGYDALSNNTTGNNNTAIGANADVTAGNLTNATAIGSGAIVNASNKIRLGNSAVTLVETDGNIKVGANDTVFSSNLSSNSPLSLQAPAGTTRMYINDVNGNVGIGTASPTKKLEVAGEIRATGPTHGYATVDRATGTNAMIMYLDGGYLKFDDYGVPTPRMVIQRTTGNVGMGTATPGASNLLELASTTKGFVLPRMTKTQRDAIASPVAGMMVYQTDNTPGLRVYNGTNWMRFTETAD